MPIYLQHGNLIDYVPPTDTSTEDVVFMGGLVGIPQAFIPAGELGALSVDGVYIFNKKDGVSVNLGDVVKYCGTTKLAQDSNADLTLGVAVADAEADDYGVKVKINSVLPTDGGGGGGGEVAISCGLTFNEIGQLYVANGCGIDFDDDDKLVVKVANGCGLDFNEHGELVATGGGGDITINPLGGLKNEGCGLGINVGGGLEVLGCTGALNLKVCTASGLSIQNGMLVASGGGGEVAVGCGLAYDAGKLIVNVANGCGGITYNNDDGSLMINVCTASGLYIDQYGYLAYDG